MAFRAVLRALTLLSLVRVPQPPVSTHVPWVSIGMQGPATAAPGAAGVRETRQSCCVRLALARAPVTIRILQPAQYVPRGPTLLLQALHRVSLVQQARTVSVGQILLPVQQVGTAVALQSPVPQSVYPVLLVSILRRVPRCVLTVLWAVTAQEPRILFLVPLVATTLPR